jgi:hypothetical protein
MMSWCGIHSGTLFSGVDEEGKVLGIHYDLEKPKKGKNKILMKLSLILDESFKDTLITIVDECVKMKFNNIECQYFWSQTSFVYDEGEKYGWNVTCEWVIHQSATT